MITIKRLLTSIVILGAVLLLTLQSVAPSDAGPLGIVGVLLLLYGISFLSIVVSAIILQVVTQRMRASYRRKDMRSITRRSYYYASLLGIIPVTLVALQSVGGVGMYELLLVGSFGVLSLLYVSKRGIR